ncbi:MAG TPA: MauE/DoxX family redox-associated membrane protein [Ktedonobacteraceae bacterium]|nr:MauE/DoxX family redox-associated membrane protein [Ktedonobacteraceae bacterium]
MFLVDINAIRLFIRLLLGLILLSVGVSKLLHRSRFERGMKEYQILPGFLESKLALSTVLSFSIPLAELVAALGLISGLVLLPATILALGMFLVFSGAIIINLVRGRSDLSCHCAGALGDHHISWWLVGRNGVFVAGLLVLLLTPSDLFTVETFVRSPSLLNGTFLSVIIPVVLIVGVILLTVVLIDSVRSL